MGRIGYSEILVTGGVIAFHDTYSWEGPKRVVEEMIFPSRVFVVIGLVDSITAVKKIAGRTPLTFLRNCCFLFLRYLYNLGRRHILPGDLRKLFKNMLGWLSYVK